ncbi:UNKNOWN [Stylonychia lemnae]|uniref:N-acetyltransferase domain-containing protein n=1 Tax=Stylonychia lemnae TaxID=5949 RepID=A0A077ZPE1_STYLE|nr:UNKNOWN [Stylonychia lemnae]|eukprot:CDW71793.1 UNKNOWN [Stylonychia lemnae]
MNGQIIKNYISNKGISFQLRKASNVQEVEEAMRLRAAYTNETPFHSKHPIDQQQLALPEWIKIGKTIFESKGGDVFCAFNQNNEIVSTLSGYDALQSFSMNPQYLTPSQKLLSAYYKDMLTQLPQNLLIPGNYVYGAMGATRPDCRMNGLMKRLMYLSIQQFYEKNFKYYLGFYTSIHNYKLGLSLGSTVIKYYDMPEDSNYECYKGQGICVAMITDLQEINKLIIQFNDSY